MRRNTDNPGACICREDDNLDMEEIKRLRSLPQEELERLMKEEEERILAEIRKSSY